MQLSTAAAAVGAWGGKWWGGNLKGALLEVHARTLPLPLTLTLTLTLALTLTLTLTLTLP